MNKKIREVEHTITFYETTDGQEFDVLSEAENHQDEIDALKRAEWLDMRTKDGFSTTNVEEAWYVELVSPEDVKAFRILSSNASKSPKQIGSWFYDEDSNEWINVDGLLNYIIRPSDANGQTRRYDVWKDGQMEKVCRDLPTAISFAKEFDCDIVSNLTTGEICWERGNA